MTPQDAARFLIQATFGATNEEITKVATKGYSAWITEQITAAPPSSHRAETMHDFNRNQTNGGTGNRNAVTLAYDRPGGPHRQAAWWKIAVEGPDQLRQRVAERLVASQATAAILTTFNEVNMQPVIELRNRYKDRFEKEHGVKLGFMGFFVKAVVHALKRFPIVNASIDGGDIVYHGYFDIGIAVGGGEGLVVPVIRDADRLSFAEIEQKIADFAERARTKQLKPEELMGGTFTITNGGICGSLNSTPLLNPPQVGILGMHAIQERPVVRDGQVVIRPMMYLALSYDHRIVDGREAVTFLRRVKELIENPARLLLEV